MLYFHKTPSLLQWVYPGLTWHGDRKEKKVYLTFDDGPVPEMTPEILDILNDFGVCATFFCVGDNVRKYPEIFSRILEEGHEPANHTFHHINGWKTGKSEYLQDVALCSGEMSALGFAPRLLRPPYGKISRKQISAVQKEYQIVMWDVLTGDFDQNLTPENCLKKTIGALQQGSIIVLHDNPKAAERTFYVLPRLLQHLKDEGLECSLFN